MERSGIPPTFEQAVAGLSDYLGRYILRKPFFLPQHPHNSPRRTRRLLDRLGRPDAALTIVRLVGTKGKGSTAAMLAAVLEAAGLRTGLYTSPHLHTPRERIQVNGEMISRPAFCALLQTMRSLLEESLAWEDLGPATLFEGLTALAMAHFARHGVELAVVEAGMGGTMDATQALAPALLLLTPIALDHQEYLGETLEAIAAEKGGAILAGGLALSAPQLPQVWRVLQSRAEEVGASLVRVEAGTVSSGLPGQHQVVNAALALAAVDHLRERGWAVPQAAVREGLRSVHWPGRLEAVAGRPLTLADGAHNVAAARALAASLETFPNRPRILVVGCSADKDLAGIVATLAPPTAEVVLTRAYHHRAVAPERLAGLVRRQGRPVTVIPEVAEALLWARRRAGPAGLVCACGSFFVVAEAREALGLAVREPWPEPATPPSPTTRPTRRPPPTPER